MAKKKNVKEDKKVDSNIESNCPFKDLDVQIKDLLFTLKELKASNSNREIIISLVECINSIEHADKKMAFIMHVAETLKK